MRKPTTIECLYLDFDGFFASVVPFDNTEYTCVIACSKEAKARGVKSMMNVKEA